MARCLLVRQARLLLGKNELRRPSDRIEGIVLVVLSAAFLTAAIMAALLAARSCQSQRSAGAGLSSATAELSRPGPVVGDILAPAVRVPAAWRLPNGASRSGFLTLRTAPTIDGARAGTRVRVWLDRSGTPQPPPPTQVGDAFTALCIAVIVGVIVTAGAVLPLLLCYRLCRVALDRHRLARWESAWAVTSPRWTSHQ